MRPRAPSSSVIVPLCLSALATFALLGAACNDDKGGGGTTPAATPGLPELLPRKVPDTELVLSLPKGWIVDMPDPGTPPPVPADGSAIQLAGRLLLQARPGTNAPGMLIAPVLHVFEDPWLPLGTTGVDYLVAQRAANQKAIGANIRHVDAEPSRRDGRPSYHVRDEWTVLGPGGTSRDVSQEAILILETTKTPDNKDAMRGYTIVITMEKAEFATLQPIVREILKTLHFDDKK